MDLKVKVGCRIEYVGSKGTVRYSGKLKHTPKNAKINVEDHWLGVEWDDPTRGNHQGTVEGVHYFDCIWSDSKRAGSLIRAEKAELGVDVFEAFVQKYFKGEEAEALLANKSHLIENLIALANKASQTPQQTGGVVSEFDDAAIIKTSISYKKIEFLGFENIWKRMKDLKALQSLAISGYKIASIGQPGSLGAVFQSLRELSLEDSLISDWGQIEQLSRELPHLETLWLSKNRLSLPAPKPPAAAGEEKQQDHKEEIQVAGFECLTAVYLSEMGLTWRDFSRIKHLFRSVTELGLAQNKLSDTENIDLTLSDFPFLKKLDVSDNRLSESRELARLAELNLKKLNLYNNQLTDILVGNNFPALTHLNLGKNQFASLTVIAQVGQFKSLESLRVGDNPFLAFEDKVHCRLLLMGGVQKLKMLNGSELKKGEKKDGEIYYLKNAFHEYFRLSQTTAFTYNLEDFYAWARPIYPVIDELIKRYDNPYPVEERFYQEAIRPNKIADHDNRPIQPQGLKLSAAFCLVNFYKIENQKEVKILIKKMPRNVDVGYMKVFLKNTLKLPAKVQGLAVKINGGLVELDNDLKKLTDYCGQEHVLSIIATL